MTIRYPVDALAAAMGETVNSCCLKLGCSGSTMQDYRTRGVTERVAESLATKAGLPAVSVWPELLEHRIADLPRCDECDNQFVRTRSHQRFCQKKCRVRWNSRRNQWRKTPEGREWARRTSARYYAEVGDYVRAQARRRYAERKVS